MSYRKLGRTSGHRRAMLRNLTTDLIVEGKIVTTEARAKEVRKTTEKMITLGKKGDLASRRRAAAFMMDVVADVKEEDDKVVVQTALQKLFAEVAPRFKERNGGYTRILKMSERRGDAAKMVVLELVD
ncbi:50S ribosomal protein L17 [Liquorilactobacillus nagelii]|jgi:large subunit ribosomal protein L17|uniref:Large ribosomal subunit protein bL17 n=1 Tax=Liquorilactobacillus nagelii TaxID=82688 RepID=A0A3S6QT95_9LACO|nr:50S ribosomal protein L17 [Liquorilactobacillus nagelii]AUJ31336.1 50S ribosomal protein L17 [Liquorilactobacillus nagelii]KRL40374.1 50S ribosomal protein L17P [Liquorilactobacillus nagelii DSM 13675]MCC7616853.1 50S ribosomal protein L17 [Liquorilactobacillus nagelii]MCI1633458.1 50S ribosomal protein L17 [Liquorilactobacillus nagelii]MCI1700317.1 50S ribosomal protein L17 [Liquorilactobacillus nagelii]